MKYTFFFVEFHYVVYVIRYHGPLYRKATLEDTQPCSETPMLVC